jgi:hypothetical protein
VRTVHCRLVAAAEEAARNVWPVRIERSVFQGDFTQTHVAWATALVIRGRWSPLAEGSEGVHDGGAEAGGAAGGMIPLMPAKAGIQSLMHRSSSGLDTRLSVNG